MENLEKSCIEKIHEIGFCGNVANRQSKIDIMKANFKDFRFDEFVIGHAMVSAINSYKVHWNANISFDINYRNFDSEPKHIRILYKRN